MSTKTVPKHREKVIAKLNIHDTAGLTRYAIGAGIIESGVQLNIVQDCDGSRWARFRPHRSRDRFRSRIQDNSRWGKHPIDRLKRFRLLSCREKTRCFSKKENRRSRYRERRAIEDSLTDQCINSMEWLAILLCPESQSPNWRKKLKMLAAAIIVGVLAAAAVGLLFYFNNERSFQGSL